MNIVLDLRAIYGHFAGTPFIQPGLASVKHCCSTYDMVGREDVHVVAFQFLREWCSLVLHGFGRFFTNAEDYVFENCLGIRGNHLSSTTCLTQVFFKSGEECDKLW